jgi:hypothetical protein
VSHLYVSPESPWWIFAGAKALLFLHVAGGSVGIVSGFVALLSRKGAHLHRVAGRVFFGSLLIMSTIGAGASPFLPVPEMANVEAGVLTLYLIATSWSTIRRKDCAMGIPEKLGLAVALAVVGAGAALSSIAASSPTGTVGNTLPQAFFLFMVVGAIGAAGDLAMIVRGGVSSAARIARHLWRMCAALTIASGSFFLGQQKMMPAFMQGSLWLFVPVFVPLLLMLFWLIRVRLGGWYARRAAA